MSCTATQFWNHTLIQGCDDPHALEDYHCVDCSVIEAVQTVNGLEYFFIEACASATYKRWKVVSDELKLLECFPGNTDSLCQSSRNMRSRGTHVEYCPPGYFVDLDACPDILASDWKTSCCQQCTNPDSEAELRRPQDWRDCTGSTTIDTQRMVDRCENNYYEKGNSCERCETCS